MQLTIYNGSPRGKAGNTEIMLKKVVEGVQSVSEVDVTWIHLNCRRQRETAHEAFPSSDLVLFGFPLYTDAMPGLAKEFIESLSPYIGRENNPTMAFMVQSGFPEASHSRPVERYLEKLARRLKAPYAGTIVKGGCEGVHLMPEQMNRKLFTGLHELGADLVQSGVLDPEKLRKLAKPEHYSKIITPLFKLALSMPIMQSYWNNQLKKNGAFDNSFARPFE
ncbi:MAG: NAD(P)H-dependent oxidoreductase [Anaerolineaceae bacterium]|nr:NAD(P)H-dependent oxidoreductase [Anaerolineaceae bacterium]